MDTATQAKYAFSAVLVGLIALSALIMLPYLLPIIGGLVLAYIFYPPYERLRGKVRRKNIAAVAMVAFVALAVLLPLGFLGQVAVQQAKESYTGTVSRLKSGELFATDCAEDQSLTCAVNARYRNLVIEPGARALLDRALQRVAEGLWNLAPQVVLAVPRFLLSLVVMLLVMFAALRDGDSIIAKVRLLVPLSRKDEELMMKRVDRALHAMLFGHVLAGLAQGVAGTVGLVLLGVGSPIFWGAVMTVTAMVPFVGAAAVWLPLSAALLLDGQTLTGSLLLAYSFLVISTIDNVIRSIVVGGRAQVSSVLVFIGVLGGVALMGFPGIIFGPLALTVTVAVLEIYPEQRS
ncbi:AI-2E family transporter [Candidatus Woesearchaeota archaeon]|nr:AI-2E family transporter [Candidatus Woesearchaeota archaeon]